MAHWQSLSLVHVVICLTFLVLGLLVNIAQLLLTLTLPRSLFKRANYYLMYCVYGYLLFLGDWWSSSKLNVYAEEDLATQLESENKGAENGLILMNHHTELDWLYSWMGADRLGVLGNCKVFAKDNLKFAPIIGWAWAMSDIIFLKRNWESDRENVATRLKTMFTASSPVWLLLFPEGTRFSLDKHLASQQFAQKSGLPQLQHHLLPRTKGFSFVMERIDRTKVEAVYDVSLVEAPISHNPFSMPSILCGRPVEGNLLMRRMPVSDVPRDQEESAKWLVALWQEKDQLKENFLSTGSFGSKYRKVSHCRGKGSLLVFLGSNILVISGVLMALAAGGIVIRSCLLASLAISWLAYHQLNSITSLAKASKHGLKKEASNS